MPVADSNYWTYGAEHEWADWPIDAELPAGCVRNRKDHTIVNSSGIANDPAGRSCRFGGEINTPPTTLSGQVDVLRALRKSLPTATVNYRSNLHVHIRAPGLRSDLVALKRVQQYIHANMPRAFDLIAPLSRPSDWDFKSAAALSGAVRRWKRCLVSHRTLLPAARLARQLAAADVDSFFAAEVPQDSAGRPLWHLQPRACVNLRQLIDTDTIEFRHFPGTLDAGEMRTALIWCSQFLEAALRDAPFDDLLKWARRQRFPRFAPYNHWIDVRFRATVRDGSIPLERVRQNVRAIENGTFEEAADQ